MRVLVWNVHGGWLDAFVRGLHDYLIPVAADGSGGRMDPDWPTNAIEVAEGELRHRDVDVVILQQPGDWDRAERLLDRRLGVDVPAIYVEHNTPRSNVPESIHPFANRDDVLLVHVTHFNEVFWDGGATQSVVIEHGVVDRGYAYDGELARGAAVINEPVRRWRVTGSDLLGRLSGAVPIDVFGMGVSGLAQRLGVAESSVRSAGNLSMSELHDEIGRRRFYLHPYRWTSLGLSLLDAMHAGMPIVALATTEAVRSIPAEAGVVSTDLNELEEAMVRFLEQPEDARLAGRKARAHALQHYGLDRFLRDWEAVLNEWATGSSRHGELSSRTLSPTNAASQR